MTYPITITVPAGGTAPASVHVAYQNMASKWRKARDCVAGQDRIREQKQVYLPPLPKMNDTQYAAYLARARFYNATKRTVEGLTGLVFRKHVLYEWPRENDPFTRDVSFERQTLNDYAEMVETEIITTARGGTLVDYPRKEGAYLTVADAERLNQRPYWVYYPTENILDWKFEAINNVPQPTYIKLVELVEKREGEVSNTFDTFSLDVRYRILDLVQNNGRLEYRVRIYEDEPVGVEAVPSEEFYPTKGRTNQRLNFIPFIFHSPANDGYSITEPPIDGLCDSNISHYQVKADHYHGLRYIALPQYWVAGVNKEDVPDTVGTARIWAFEEDAVKVGLLEYTGKGLEELREEERNLEHHMAQQGARILGAPQGYNESATSAAIRSMGETATLGKITNAISSQLSQALRITAWWEGLIEDETDDSVWVKLNMDFHAAMMDSQMVLALVHSWQSGAMSQETMFYNFKQGELTPPTVDFEDEKRMIADNPPPQEEPTQQGGNGAAQISREKAPGITTQ